MVILLQSTCSKNQVLDNKKGCL